MSEELKILEELKKDHFVDGRLPLIDKIRFEKIETKLKAFTIIKDKRVNVSVLSVSGNVKTYNYYAAIKISNNEFKFLRKELGYE